MMAIRAQLEAQLDIANGSVRGGALHSRGAAWHTTTVCALCVQVATLKRDAARVAEERAEERAAWDRGVAAAAAEAAQLREAVSSQRGRADALAARVHELVAWHIATGCSVHTECMCL